MQPELDYRNLVLAPGHPALSGAIQRGEIVGLAGLEGQGQEDFLHVLAGLRPPVSGEVRAGDQPIASLRQAAAHGIGYLPRDRRATGIFPVMSVLDNFGLPSMPAFSVFGLLDRRRQRRKFREFVEFLDIRHPGEGAPISALSGGNQQKVLLARWLAMEPRVLLLNDPTRGVDLGTRLKFYDAFRKLREETGLSLVILSSEIEEILEVCDRVLVFRDHAVERSLPREEMTMDRVLAAMFGQEAA